MTQIATIPIRLSAPAQAPISVAWATRAGTAQADVSFVPASGTVTWAVGETVKNAVVTIPGGALPGVFYVDLTTPQGAVIAIPVSTVTLTSDLPNDLLPLFQAMMTAHFAYIQRATGAAAAAAGMPPLVTAEGLVKNNQQPEQALGGYVPDGVASSEGISLMLRGIARGYAATGLSSYLAYANFLMDAACEYFFFGDRPPETSSPPWYHTWLVNAGEPFAVRGPLAENGSLVQGGYIGVPVTFTGGVGVLSPAPSIVYQAVTAGSQFTWPNVFADLFPGTGERVAVSYYIDRDGNKVFGTQKGGSFGQPIQANSGEPPGRIVLAGGQTGTFLVNWSVPVPSVQIGYGVPYEGWPMWRNLAENERAIAADAIHWFADAFRTLAAANPGNAEWDRAHTRILETWEICCDHESNSLNIFKAGTAGDYNNFPLTYAYAYGFNPDTSSWEASPPTTRFTAARTNDGFVTFAAPLANGTTSEGTRFGVTFECQSLFLNYGSGDAISASIGVSATTALLYQFRRPGDVAGQEFKATVVHTAGSPAVATIPIQSFARFTGSVWTAERGSFTFAPGGVTVTSEMDTLPNGGSIVVQRAAMNAGYHGWGIDRQNAYPFAEWTTPPGILYKTTSAEVIYAVKDAAQEMWQMVLPAQASLAHRNVSWSDLTWVAGGGGGAVTAPSAPAAGIILGVQVQTQLNASTISIGYIGAAPEYASTGKIDLFNVTNSSPLAFTWKVGDVALTGGVRDPIEFFGSLPFGFMLGGPSRGALSTTPYRGPYIAGYQSGTPWVDLGNAAKLSAMLDFLAESQDQFTARHPQGLSGPFMHCYLPATWDSLQTGAVDTWVWDAPDGNPAWPGWQWRAFDGIAQTWAAADAAGMTVQAGQAGVIATRFLDWLHGWLAARPEADYLPSEWGPPGWSQGVPLPPSSYLDPHGTTLEPHDAALAMKGAIYCFEAGADAARCKYIVRRCARMLQASHVGGTGPMRGAFSLAPAEFKAYGFAQGEIHDALGLAVQHPTVLV